MFNYSPKLRQQIILVQSDIISLDLINPKGLPHKQSKNYAKYEVLMQEIVDNAPQIVLSQSSIPPVTAFPLGAPIEINNDVRCFKVASWMSCDREDDTLDGSRQIPQNIISKKIVTDPSKVFLNLKDEATRLSSDKDIQLFIEKECFSQTITNLYQQNTKFGKQKSTERYFVNKNDFRQNDTILVKECRSYLENNQNIYRKHNFMEESTFQLGDVIRIGVSEEHIVLLVTRIWAVDTDFMPHLFVDGEVITKMPKTAPYSAITQSLCMQTAYCIVGASVTLPLTDFNVIESLERAPAVLLIKDSNIFYHLPFSGNTENQLEFNKCCEENTTQNQMNLSMEAGSAVIAEPNQTQQTPESCDIEDVCYQTIDPDGDGFAIGERLKQPIHIVGALLQSDQNHISQIIASLLLKPDYKQFINFKPTTVVLPNTYRYDIYQNKQQVQWPVIFSEFQVSFIPINETYESAPEPTEITTDNEYIVFTLSSGFTKRDPNNINCNCNLCSLKISPNYFKINDISQDFIINSDEQLKNTQSAIMNNRINNAIHCMYCGAVYHPECLYNKMSTFQKYVKQLVYFGGPFTGINATCVKCAEHYAKNHSIISIDKSNIFHLFIRDQIRFMKPYNKYYTDELLNNFDYNAMYDMETKQNPKLKNLLTYKQFCELQKIQFRILQKNWHLCENIKSFSNQYIQNVYDINVLLFASQLRVYTTINNAGECALQLIFFKPLPYYEAENQKDTYVNPSNNMDFVLEFYQEAFSRIQPLNANLYYTGAPLYNLKYIYDYQNVPLQNIIRAKKQELGESQQQQKQQNDQQETETQDNQPSLQQLIYQQISEQAEKDYGYSITYTDVQTPTQFVNDTLPTKVTVQKSTQKTRTQFQDNQKSLKTFYDEAWQLIGEQNITNQARQRSNIFKELAENNKNDLDLQQYKQQKNYVTAFIKPPQSQDQASYTNPTSGLIEQFKHKMQLGSINLSGVEQSLGSLHQFLDLNDQEQLLCGENNQLMNQILQDAPLTIDSIKQNILRDITDNQQLRYQSKQTEVERFLMQITQKRFTPEEAGATIKKLQQIKQIINAQFNNAQVAIQEKIEPNQFPMSQAVNQYIIKQRIDELQQCVVSQSDLQSKQRQNCEKIISQIESLRTGIFVLKGRISDLITTLQEEYLEKLRNERGISINTHIISQLAQLVNDQLTEENANETSNLQKDKQLIDEMLLALVQELTK